MRKGIGTVRQRASRRDKRCMSKADPRVVEAVMVQVPGHQHREVGHDIVFPIEFDLLPEHRLSLAQLPQLEMETQCFPVRLSESCHYIWRWIIFEGSFKLSFSRRICW